MNHFVATKIYSYEHHRLFTMFSCRNLWFKFLCLSLSQDLKLCNIKYNIKYKYKVKYKYNFMVDK